MNLVERKDPKTEAMRPKVGILHILTKLDDPFKPMSRTCKPTGITSLSLAEEGQRSTPERNLFSLSPPSPFSHTKVAPPLSKRRTHTATFSL